MISIRPATLKDILAITEIYNQAVLTTDATFDTEPKTVEEQKAWFDEQDAHHPVLVAEADGEVVAWASLSRYSSRRAYDRTAEYSIYVEEEFRNRGVGKRLTEATLQAGSQLGLRTVIARITTGNEVSLRMHEKAGFNQTGVLVKVGHKFDRDLDVCMLQYLYGE